MADTQYSNIRTTAQSAAEGRLKVDAGYKNLKKKRSILKKAIRKSY